MINLIARVYDCVFDPNLWPPVLAEVCERAGGCAASLNAHSLPDLAPELAVEHGTSPEYSRTYVETYGRINPLFSAVLFDMAEGETRTLAQAVDVAAFHRSRFYREWVKPQGWGDWSASILTRNDARLALLAVARRAADGSFATEQQAFLRDLIPHLRRAVTLARLFKPAPPVEKGLAALLERFGAAALLVDADGRVAYANSRAEALLARGDLLIDPGRNGAPAERTARSLKSLIDAAGAAGGVCAAPTSTGARLVSVMPASEETGGYIPVLIAEPEAARPPPGPLLRAAFGLTQAETRVLAELLAGRSLAEVAGNFGVAPRTVKAHLQKLFHKTGVTRQADLLRKAMSLSPPFA